MLDRQALADLIESSTLQFKKSATSYIFDCPRCQRKDKLYVHRQRGSFICFYCAEIDGYRGRPEFALSDLLGLSLSEIRAKLYGTTDRPADATPDFSVPNFFDDYTVPADVIEPGPAFKMPAEFFPIDCEYSKPGVEYLAKRGVPLEIAREYGLKYWAQQRRVVFPVQKIASRQLCGYQGRAIFDANLKILSSKEIPRGESLIFADRITDSHVVLTEGPFDAIKAHYCGGNVAAMGKVVNEQQLELILARGVKKIYLALDPDASQEMSLLVQRIGGRAEVFHMRPPDGCKDFGEATFEQVKKAFDNAEPVNPLSLFVYVPNSACF